MNSVTLASLRANSKITQRKLADALKFAPSAVAMYETGKRTPSLKRAKKIAEYFSVPVESLIFGNLAHKMRAKYKTDELQKT